ncbi:Ca2+-dependent phosphoinositide-specific phospholipase C [Asticcacaulis benevestitus]|uniref:Ca2+-dependent phosphoinositide-specific phospholipase C n=1 Tax=Asticcacaulis benevestitus TaxID=347481 RepID=UPI0012DD41C0|nr:Ca2+-dependent phosphoinositide-specific phospholipase C [Asticcacaulis benevestitus]
MKQRFRLGSWPAGAAICGAALSAIGVALTSWVAGSVTNRACKTTASSSIAPLSSGRADTRAIVHHSPCPGSGHITQLIKQGFFFGSRAGAKTMEPPIHDLKRFDEAVDAGAQAIGTDYDEGAPDPYGSIRLMLLLKASLSCDA